MPANDYLCENCGHKDEINLSVKDIGDKVKPPCENCGHPMKIQIGSIGLIVVHDIERGGVKGCSVTARGCDNYRTTMRKTSDGRHYYHKNNPGEDPLVIAREKEMKSNVKSGKTVTSYTKFDDI